MGELCFEAVIILQPSSWLK